MRSSTLEQILTRIREQGGPFAEPLARRNLPPLRANGSRPKSIWLARLDRPKEDMSYLVVLDKLGRPSYWRWPWDHAATQLDTISEDDLLSSDWDVFDWNIECLPDNNELGPWYDQNGYEQ